MGFRWSRKRILPLCDPSPQDTHTSLLYLLARSAIPQCTLWYVSVGVRWVKKRSYSFSYVFLKGYHVLAKRQSQYFDLRSSKHFVVSLLSAFERCTLQNQQPELHIDNVSKFHSWHHKSPCPWDGQRSMEHSPAVRLYVPHVDVWRKPRSRERCRETYHQNRLQLGY